MGVDDQGDTVAVFGTQEIAPDPDIIQGTESKLGQQVARFSLILQDFPGWGGAGFERRENPCPEFIEGIRSGLGRGRVAVTLVCQKSLLLVRQFGSVGRWRALSRCNCETRGGGGVVLDS